jgi:hypothetical protein
VQLIIVLLLQLTQLGSNTKVSQLHKALQHTMWQQHSAISCFASKLSSNTRVSQLHKALQAHHIQETA